jgi:hypothetical protein
MRHSARSPGGVKFGHALFQVRFEGTPETPLGRQSFGVSPFSSVDFLCWPRWTTTRAASRSTARHCRKKEKRLRMVTRQLHPVQALFSVMCPRYKLRAASRPGRRCRALATRTTKRPNTRFQGAQRSDLACLAGSPRRASMVCLRRDTPEGLGGRFSGSMGALVQP